MRHRDVHILTAGEQTFTTDQRFSAKHNTDDEWVLVIKYVQVWAGSRTPHLQGSRTTHLHESRTPHLQDSRTPHLQKMLEHCVIFKHVFIFISR